MNAATWNIWGGLICVTGALGLLLGQGWASASIPVRVAVTVGILQGPLAVYLWACQFFGPTAFALAWSAASLPASSIAVALVVLPSMRRQNRQLDDRACPLCGADRDTRAVAVEQARAALVRKIDALLSPDGEGAGVRERKLAGDGQMHDGTHPAGCEACDWLRAARGETRG